MLSGYTIPTPLDLRHTPMNKRSPAARLFAVIALALAFVVAVIVIAGALGGDSEESGTRRHDGGAAIRRADEQQQEAPANYVVKSGDTLTSIARATGVPIVRIEALNPEVDPQILIAGEKLKLR
jgi:LysM repeat protein